MTIANATGCSSIYGASFPATPYTTNAEGKGPAWANSLFEDNAEFGFGMHIAAETLRNRIGLLMEENIEKVDAELAGLFTKWLDNRNSGEVTKALAPQLEVAIANSSNQEVQEILDLKDYLVKQSNWIIGGDGWAYDIGYGGLDHVIANNEDVNILVLDTEVYSNTGGQSSKSSRAASIAKFTASGKGGKKKDLAAIAMSYGHVYGAQVSHGANQAQVIKAMMEAEKHQGPSIVIAYSPCIAHGIKGGLANSMSQAKLATECGYWPTYRFNPELLEAGKNPLQLDSKAPNWDKYRDFLMSEARYAQVTKINPDHAEELLEANRKDAQRRFRQLQRMAALDFSDEVEVEETVTEE